MSLLPRSIATARAASLAVLAAALIAGTIVRWTPPRQVADLDPRPDALEYEEGARNLVRGEGYCLIVEGKKYPPRYPFGFSLLLAPFLAAAGDAPGTGIWAVLACAWVAIVATWWLGWLAGGPWSAAAAALLLSLSGLHVAMSRAVMSDAPSAALVAALGAAGIVALGRSTPGAPPGRGEPPRWLALGIAAGLVASMRATNLLLLAPIACLLGLDRACARRSRVVRLAALSSGAALGVLPMLLYNHARFGSPFATGYGFWVPARYFDAKYVFGPAFQAVDRADEANLPFYARALSGDAAMYPRPIAILIVLGAALSLARSARSGLVAVVGLGFGGALLVVHLFFFWQGERFLLPALPFLLAIASSTLGSRSPPALRLSACVLLVWGLSSLAVNPDLRASVAQGDEVERLHGIDRLVEANAAVIVDSNDFLFDRVLRNSRDRLWLPARASLYRREIRRRGLKPYATADERENWVRELGTGPSAAGATIAQAIREGRPVYFAGTASDAKLAGWITREFQTRLVGSPGGTDVFRVEPRCPAQTR